MIIYSLWIVKYDPKTAVPPTVVADIWHYHGFIIQNIVIGKCMNAVLFLDICKLNHEENIYSMEEDISSYVCNQVTGNGTKEIGDSLISEN